MCGRGTNRLTWAEIAELLNLDRDLNTPRNTQARYNICPTDPLLFCRLDRQGHRVIDEGMWWLVPHWARERPKVPMINARMEEVATKPAWRDAFKAKRCLIPMDGYFEWTVGPDKGKDPWFIHMPGQAPFCFAGLYAHNRTLDVTSCAIITAPAVEPVSQIHERMPVVLSPSVYGPWLDPETEPQRALEILRNEEIDHQMVFYRVDRRVNSSKYQDGGAATIEPVAA